MLVTFLKDADLLAEALIDSGAVWVQLHGYQTPGTVRKVKEIDPEVRVIKVLHISGSECVEETLIRSYEKAGVDVFLLDPVSDKGQVGSTGQTLDAAYALTLADKLVAAVPARRRALGGQRRTARRPRRTPALSRDRRRHERARRRRKDQRREGRGDHARVERGRGCLASSPTPSWRRRSR